jgi:hypothetical protein
VAIAFGEPKDFSNSTRYPAMALIFATTSAWVLPISMGLAMGPLACSSSVDARPSQNWFRL